MGNKISTVIAGMGTLIFVYLVLHNYKGTTSVINSLGSNATKGIKALQGR